MITAVAVTGACSETPPTDPSIEAPGKVQLFGTPANPQADALNTFDARLARIAEQVPGFGGVFLADGHLNVYMAATAQARTPSAVQSAVGAELTALGIDLTSAPVRVLSGDYDFAQLHATHGSLRPVLSLDGVVFTDVDEAANRVRIGVSSDAARASVERTLAMSGVDQNMVIVSDAEPIEFMQGLRDLVRPVAGGLQIVWPDLAGSNWLCTIGFNVRSPSAPNVHGFVTNSHCSAVQFELNENPYWQPSPGLPNSLIGTEAHDAPGFTGGQCPAGRVCRNSDAAGVIYAEGVENAFGHIYRTTGVNSLTIDPNNRMWNIISEAGTNQVVGTEVHKTGRTTGWAWGNVSGSCAQVNVGGTNFTLFCQDLVSGSGSIVGGGDSGSGAYRRLGTGADSDVELVGILWGGSGSSLFVYSPMERIRMDNPPPAGVADWVTH